MAQLVRRALLETAPRNRWRDAARRAASILRSFSLSVSTDGVLTGAIDVEPLVGVADSGDLSEDLTDLLVALGEAARQHETGVVFLLDEVQFLAAAELEALLAALHKIVQREIPIAIVGAGLPQLPRLAGEAKSYAERLFRFLQIGALGPGDAAEALTRPAEELTSCSSPRGRDGGDVHRGYPYFIQEYGKVLWDRADGSRSRRSRRSRRRRSSRSVWTRASSG